ncbi:MAG: sigma-54 dependent transcriptional regulator [Pseudomonadota bacterium]
MSQANAAKQYILIVDDEPDIRELLSMTIDAMGIKAVEAASITDAMRKLNERSFDLCLTDMRLPDGDGLDLVSHIQQHHPGLPVAVITAHGSVESAVTALKNGAFDFLSKPLDLSNLRSIVSTALQMDAAESARAAPLIGESDVMHQVRDIIARVARSQAPVHIRGESGTGKELVARMIHDASGRREAAFVPVNCGAIPPELMESEFFGHRKGSFTGAVSDKEGLFQAADGGTLFLDEIAELPLPMQVKLLRVIQEKKVRPVGAASEQPVDVRILSATHQDLAALSKDHAFREDLFYRVNVIELPVPPLRDRGDDIELLSNRFLESFAAQHQVGEKSLTDAARAALRRYPFPGNVRELENIIERAVTLSPGDLLDVDDLRLEPTAPAGAAQAPMNSAGMAPQAGVSGLLTPQLEDVERQAIREALEQTRYNKTAAAKLLGLTFRQLRYRIKKLGIE